MSCECCIDYVEFVFMDFVVSCVFFEKVFGWLFVDYGSDYMVFDDGCLQGGFFRGQLLCVSDVGVLLLVLYVDQLVLIEVVVFDVGGEIVWLVFFFFGGSCFQFVEFGGNELVVWFECDLV